MTAKHIEEQIAVIREATDRASVSTETATAFLREAGIISQNNGKVVSRNAVSDLFVERHYATKEQTQNSKSENVSSHRSSNGRSASKKTK